MDMVACCSLPPLLLEGGDPLSPPLEPACACVATASGEALEPGLLSERRFRLPEAALVATVAPAQESDKCDDRKTCK